MYTSMSADPEVQTHVKPRTPVLVQFAEILKNPTTLILFLKKKPFDRSMFFKEKIFQMYGTKTLSQALDVIYFSHYEKIYPYLIIQDSYSMNRA